MEAGEGAGAGVGAGAGSGSGLVHITTMAEEQRWYEETVGREQWQRWGQEVSGGRKRVGGGGKRLAAHPFMRIITTLLNLKYELYSQYGHESLTAHDQAPSCNIGE